MTRGLPKLRNSIAAIAVGFVTTITVLVGTASPAPPTSKAPQITSVVPNRGYPGTIVSVHGNNLGGRKAEAFFGSTLADILSGNPNTLRVAVPWGADADHDDYLEVRTRAGRAGIAFDVLGIGLAYEKLGANASPDIWIAGVDGGDPVRLTDHPAEDSHPAWSPDGTKIAFVSGRDGNPEIYVMDANGQNVRRLTRRTATFDAFPTWSWDGTRIAFQTVPGMAVYVMDADGRNQRRLTSGITPAWSPVDDRIAFSRDGDIWTINADGSDEMNVTNNGFRNAAPSWSPDGTMIAYQSRRNTVDDPAKDPEPRSEIFVIGADGFGGETQLTFREAWEFDGFPAWSPVGEKIAFFSWREDERDLGIYIMNVDGSGREILIEGGSGPAWFPLLNPSW
jgi:hypothetical protein